MHTDGMPGWPAWEVAQHLDLMDQCGIATSILSIFSPGVCFGDPADASDLARHVNDAEAEIRRDHPPGSDTSPPCPVRAGRRRGPERAGVRHQPARQRRSDRRDQHRRQLSRRPVGTKRTRARQTPTSRFACMSVLSKRMYLPASSFRAATNRPVRLENDQDLKPTVDCVNRPSTPL